MRRLFWLGAGAAVGILVVRRLRTTAAAFTPAGMTESLTAALGGLGETVRDFAAEVRAGMAEREADLRQGLGLDGTHDVVDADHLGDPRPPR